MRAKELLEYRPYAVVIAGVRIKAASEREARAIAVREVSAWINCGYPRGREAVIYYRDGSRVAALGAAGVAPFDEAGEPIWR